MRSQAAERLARKAANDAKWLTEQGRNLAQVTAQEVDAMRGEWHARILDTMQHVFDLPSYDPTRVQVFRRRKELPLDRAGLLRFARAAQHILTREPQGESAEQASLFGDE